MSSIFRKNFHLCFSKIKCLPTSNSPPLTLEDDEHEHEYKHEYREDLNQPPSNTITIEKFNSIYDNPSLFSSSSTTIIDDFSTSSSSYSARESLDFSAIFASQRLFVGSPGDSNSILESLSTSSSSGDRLAGGGVAIKKYSPDPYTDFRKSMQEMIEAREVEKKTRHPNNDEDEGDDLLEYLQELLLCYLNLNPKHTHKFIIEAFADILLSMSS